MPAGASDGGDRFLGGPCALDIVDDDIGAQRTEALGNRLGNAARRMRATLFLRLVMAGSILQLGR